MLTLAVDYLRLLILEMWSLCQEMAPFLLLGMAIAGLISIFINSRFILKHLGSKNLFSTVKSTVFGIPLPLCSCGVIPVAATLREAGASKGSTVSFLVSTPQTGVDSIFLTYGMLGPVFALFRPLAAFISGIFSGLVINSFDDDAHSHQKPETEKECDVKQPLVKRLESGVRYGFLSLPCDIVVPLFQGLIIAAAITIFVPTDFIAEKFISNSYLMLFMMLFVSLPIYVCATASIPIALVLMAKGVSAGAVFVFLMAGPTTNASSIVVIKNILGRKTMFHFLLLTASTAMLFGFILDTFIVIDPLAISGVSHVHTTDGWGTLTLTILFLMILLNAYTYKLKEGIVETDKGENDFDASEDRFSIGVHGMTCSHCKESVESAVYSCGGVKDISVNLKTGEVMVLGSGLNEAEIREKIKSRGFSLD
tara:strand:+ start:16306 stop:17574 length:1269 start_codon:yes stop_codon:yes gene_type:complete